MSNRKMRNFREKRSYPCLAILVAIVFTLLLPGWAKAADRDAELQEILKRAVESIRRVKNFSGVSREYEPMDTPGFEWSPELKASKIVERSPEGFGLLAEIQITVDRVGSRYRFEKRQFLVVGPQKDPIIFFSNATLDGKVYRTFVLPQNRGLQKSYLGELSTFRSLHSFLGDSMGGDPALFAKGNLVDWLNTPSGWSFVSEPRAKQPRLKRLYRTDLYASEMRLFVTLSPEHDYLPISYETFWCETETINERLTVEKFHKVKPEGIWIPVRGNYEVFSREAVFPPGITLEMYKEMTPKEKKSVDPKVTWRPISLCAPRLIVIDPQTIKINQKLPDSTFVYDFPPDSLIFDEKTQKVLRGGKEPIEK